MLVPNMDTVRVAGHSLYPNIGLRERETGVKNSNLNAGSLITRGNGL